MCETLLLERALKELVKMFSFFMAFMAVCICFSIYPLRKTRDDGWNLHNYHVSEHTSNFSHILSFWKDLWNRWNTKCKVVKVSLATVLLNELPSCVWYHSQFITLANWKSQFRNCNSSLSIVLHHRFPPLFIINTACAF